MSVGVLPATGSYDVYLFNSERLSKLSKWAEFRAKLEQRNLLARPLKQSDYDNGYLELLSQLTEVGNITREQFQQRFQQMKQSNQIGDHYVVVVIEDNATKRLVGTSTLILELKFIHECAIRGQLEDVAVLDTFRGKQIGEIVVGIIVELAREQYNCYKLSLNCKDELVKFYSKNNFTYGNKMLCIRFDQ